MARNQPAVDSIKSVPCIGTSSPIIQATSDHSMSSFKSFNTDTDDREMDKPTEKLPNVKALIAKLNNNNKLLKGKILNAKAHNFEDKKKSFGAACENLVTSYNDCLNMKGDEDEVENVNSFVKNHVLDLYTVSTHTTLDPIPQVDQNFLKSKNFDLKTGTPELDTIMNNMGMHFWQKIISVVEVNQVYHQCLEQIIDAKKFKNLQDVIAHVTSVLEKGKEYKIDGQELMAICKEHLEKSRTVLDSKLKEKPKVSPLLSLRKKLNALEQELAENKRSMKIAENKVTLLKKENKDLTNILNSYDTTNVNKVSLEKRLEAEQEKNDELRSMIATVFKKKMSFYANSDEDYSQIINKN